MSAERASTKRASTDAAPPGNRSAPYGPHTLEAAGGLSAKAFEIAVKRLAETLSYGADRSPFRGAGLDYVQSRVYQPGDPVRLIDWKVTARTGRLHVKEHEAPKRLPIYLLVDTSASMAVRSGSQSKYALAVQLAGALALSALERLSPVGLLTVGDRALRVTPSLSKDQVHQWLHKLRRHRTDERTTLGKRVLELATTLTVSSLVIVLSDLFDPLAIPALKRLRQRHDTIVCLLTDPAEAGLVGAGFVRGREAETGARFTARAASLPLDASRRAQTLRDSGIDHLTLRTDEPVTTRLRHFLKHRARAR